MDNNDVSGLIVSIYVVMDELRLSDMGYFWLKIWKQKQRIVFYMRLILIVSIDINTLNSKILILCLSAEKKRITIFPSHL